MFPIELVIDEVARELRRDPLDVRIANLYGTTTRNVTPYGMTVEDNVAPEIIAQLETSSRYRQRRRARSRMESRESRHQARHCADAGQVRHLVHRHALQPGRRAAAPVQRRHAAAQPRRHRDGSGAVHKVAQVVAQELGVPLPTVRVSASDTSKVPNASPTAASSGSDINGMAARDAARTLRARLVGVRGPQVRLRSADRRVRQRRRDRGRQDAAVRGTGADGVHGARAAVRHRLLRDARRSTTIARR